MNHLTEEQLVWRYYGEGADNPETEEHLKTCGECRASFVALQEALNTLDSLPVPERGAAYGAEVWQRLGPQVPARRRWWLAGGGTGLRWAAGAAMLALVAAAFLAGRWYAPRPAAPQRTSDGALRERVLLVALGDYLDRSQIVLVELANASAEGPLDISLEQERAQDLIREARLYRQTAALTGDAPLSAILEELERLMLEIARGPSALAPTELEAIRARLQAEGILFKIRVVSSNLRSREAAAANESPGNRL